MSDSYNCAKCYARAAGDRAALTAAGWRFSEWQPSSVVTAICATCRRPAPVGSAPTASDFALDEAKR